MSSFEKKLGVFLAVMCLALGLSLYNSAKAIEEAGGAKAVTIKIGKELKDIYTEIVKEDK